MPASLAMAATTWAHKLNYPTGGNLRSCWVSVAPARTRRPAQARLASPAQPITRYQKWFRDMPVTCGDLGGSGPVSVRYLLTCP